MEPIPTDKKVVVFGELMMRLQTSEHERLVQVRQFEVFYSGVESHLVSSIPDNAIGQACPHYVRQFGINLDHMCKNGFRLGIYFVETGASQRPQTHKGSSITELRPGEFDWDRIFAGKTWFHFCGITPALVDNVGDITLEACRAAKRMGLTVSCDLNFRKTLWTKEKARTVMTGLMGYVDVLFTNEEEVETVFGISAHASDVDQGQISSHGYEKVAVLMRERFGFDYVSISLRESISATTNNWSGMMYDGKSFYTSRRYHINSIVDRDGGGDAYSAGIIYGLLTGQDWQQTVDFAAAASCLKHTIQGDFNVVSFNETLALMNGDGSGRIQRYAAHWRELAVALGPRIVCQEIFEPVQMRFRR